MSSRFHPNRISNSKLIAGWLVLIAGLILVAILRSDRSSNLPAPIDPAANTQPSLSIEPRDVVPGDGHYPVVDEPVSAGLSPETKIDDMTIDNTDEESEDTDIDEASTATPDRVPPSSSEAPDDSDEEVEDADDTDVADESDRPPSSSEAPDDSPAGPYPVFTGNQFKQLFDEVELDNLATVGDLPAIVGNPETDQRVRQIAVERGYRPRPMPADVSKLVLAEGDRHRLQPAAAEAYHDLRAAAAADGLTIWLVSAYRSYDYQGPLFLRGVSAPYSDDDVFERLKTVAIPGYSKHHTGYAIDLAEGNFVFDEFIESASYTWLSADNYANARRHGWIPSYPPDADNQGPDPEPWEFVYVGQQYLVSQPG